METATSQDTAVRSSSHPPPRWKPPSRHIWISDGRFGTCRWYLEGVPHLSGPLLTVRSGMPGDADFFAWYGAVDNAELATVEAKIVEVTAAEQVRLAGVAARAAKRRARLAGAGNASGA